MTEKILYILKLCSCIVTAEPGRPLPSPDPSRLWQCCSFSLPSLEKSDAPCSPTQTPSHPTRLNTALGLTRGLDKSKWKKSFQLSKCSHISRLKGADFRSVPLSLYFIHCQNLNMWRVSHVSYTWLWGVLQPPWDTGSVSSGTLSPALHMHLRCFSLLGVVFSIILSSVMQ